MADFLYEDLLPIGDDTTEYRLLTTEGVSTVEGPDGRTFLQVEPEAMRLLTETALHDISHYLRTDHLTQLASILDDPEAAKYAWGIGFHWYETWAGGEPMHANVAAVREAWPGVNLLLTEATVERFDPERLQDWANAERYGRQIIGDFNAGAVGWTDWPPRSRCRPAITRSSWASLTNGPSCVFGSSGLPTRRPLAKAATFSTNS